MVKTTPIKEETDHTSSESRPKTERKPLLTRHTSTKESHKHPLPYQSLGG